MVSSGISDVAFASVNSEKTRLNKLMITIIIITSNKSDGYETEARKVMVDFKFDALYR